ncbi:hypothetical protein Moror_1196 [Moniliophthora roreri MCA 2997]|uniref:Uncharacterized protein n=1 Tax=Moniliophthora roreri (strain MCA 2997) TaxID=1381753 RepID=V2X9Q3_MONRO|nr:hypothetical protein Moror_1196 [Moniliophthora roreri MCA 2997]
MAPAQGEKGALSPPIFVHDEDEQKFQSVEPSSSGQTIGTDPDMVTISVSRAFAEEATLRAVSEFRKELTQVRNDLRTSRERTDALEEEVNELRKTSRERLDEMENKVKVAKQEAEDAKAAVQKLKAKMKSKLSALADRITVAEETLEQQGVEPETAPSTAAEQKPGHIYKTLFDEVKQMEMFQGPFKLRGQAASVSFMRMEACYEMGWQREFSDRLTKACSKSKDCTRNGFLYFPGRVAFAGQHGLAMVPMAQTSTEHGFELASTFDGLSNVEWELFHDRSMLGGPAKSTKIFYAGTFQCVELKDLHPDGMKYYTFLESNHGFSFDSLIQAVVEAQVQKPLLRRDEIRSLIFSGAVKIEFIGLKMVGFNEELYRCVTASDTASSGTKRPQDSSASGSAPKPKRTKRS